MPQISLTNVKTKITEDSDKWLREHGPTAHEEWSFDPVPDAELIPCCYWEYARESRTIMLLAEVQWCNSRHYHFRNQYEAQPELRAAHDEHANLVAQWVEHAGFDFDAVLDEYWKSDFPFIHCCDLVVHSVGDGAKPWQRLAPEIKRHLVAKLDESIILRPLAPAMLGELEELWKHNAADLMEFRATVHGANEDSDDETLWTESESVEPFHDQPESKQEKRTVAFTVDFSRFTDKEITEAFQQWLKVNRPASWKKPRRVFPGSRGKGRKILDYRVALERLGMMRLLHWHSPAALAAELPEAWEKIRRKEPDFRREIRLGSQFMHSLFPFLPKEERPESEERFGVWMPEMQKIADEVEREMGLEGAANAE